MILYRIPSPQIRQFPEACRGAAEWGLPVWRVVVSVWPTCVSDVPERSSRGNKAFLTGSVLHASPAVLPRVTRGGSRRSTTPASSPSRCSRWIQRVWLCSHIYPKRTRETAVLTSDICRVREHSSLWHWTLTLKFSFKALWWPQTSLL